MKVLTGLIVTLLLGILPADADLSGRWNVAMLGHIHINNVVLDMKQNGTAITASCLIPDHGDLTWSAPTPTESSRSTRRKTDSCR